MRRDLLIVALLALALTLTACASQAEPKPFDWTDLAADAIPRFGRDDCGQTLTWDRELGRWTLADGQGVVIDARLVIRVDCDAEGNPAPALIQE